MSSFIIFILLMMLFASSISSFKTSQNYQPGGKKMIIYGIYQSCGENTTSLQPSSTFRNTSQESDHVYISQRKANACGRSIKWIDKHKMEVNKAIMGFWKRHFKHDPSSEIHMFPKRLDWSLNDIEYKSLYICSPMDLEREAVNLLLDKDNFVKIRFGKVEENIWNNRRIYLNAKEKRRHSHARFQHTRILGVLLYANDVLSTKAVQLLSSSQFPIYHLRSGWIKPEANSLHYKKNIFTETYTYNKFYGIMTEIFRKQQVYYFVMVFFKSDNFLYNKMYTIFRNQLERQPEFCFRVYEIQQLEEFDSVIRKIKSDARLRLVVTFGNPENQVIFFNEALSKGLQNLSWVFQDVRKDSNFIHSIPDTSKVITLLTNPFYLYRNTIIEELLSKQSPNCPLNQLIKNCTKHIEEEDFEDIGLFCKLKITSLFNGYIFGLWRENNVEQIWYSLFQKRFKLHVQRVYVSNPFYYLRRRRHINGSYTIVRMKLRSYPEEKLNSTCFSPTCEKGFEIQTTFKDSYYGQHCIKCPDNHYNNESGNTTCRPCPRHTVSMTSRDSCYDPYKETFPSLDQWSVRIALFINASGGVFSSIAVLVFLYRRDTPLVRAMDLNISLQHLLSLLITFITTPYLFIGKPRQTICFLRPLLVSVLNNLSVAFVIAKSQRLLKIFISKMMILTECEMRRYNIFVGTGIFLICGIGQAFLLLPVSNIKIKVVEVRIDKEMIRDVHCNTEDYINIQLVYLIVLQLFTAFQAFRCRSLPGPFNEAMSIVYSTLIVIATYSATFPIYYFQHTESTKANVHFLSLSVANIFSMLILYGNRLFIVVFKRKKNSKNYVRRQIWSFSSDT